jgi:hypothetical protein
MTSYQKNEKRRRANPENIDALTATGAGSAACSGAGAGFASLDGKDSERQTSITVPAPTGL